MNLFDVLKFYNPKAIFTVENNSFILWETPQPEPTKEQIEEWKLSYPHDIAKQDCKNKAKQLLAASDWTQAPDVNLTNKSEFAVYREKLRDLVFNPVENPVWPTEPEEKWG